MAILYTCDEFYALATLTLVDGFSQMLVEILNKYIGIGSFKITTIMSDNLSILKCDDIATNSKVIISHFVTYTGSLERATSFIYLIQIIA